MVTVNLLDASGFDSVPIIDYHDGNNVADVVYLGVDFFGEPIGAAASLENESLGVMGRGPVACVGTGSDFVYGTRSESGVWFESEDGDVDRIHLCGDRMDVVAAKGYCSQMGLVKFNPRISAVVR